LRNGRQLPPKSIFSTDEIQAQIDGNVRASSAR
jgi:hypothetical protein